jgi:hypothetical protein
MAPVTTMAAQTDTLILTTGSYIEITGGKYVGHYATFTGYTPTGQCRIQLDNGRSSKPGAILTKNQKTRCARHHAKAAKALQLGEPTLEDDLELVLLARLVALKLRDTDNGKRDENKKFEDFIRLVQSF